MALCHKWDVKNDFVYVLQFFSLISDSLGSVILKECFYEDLPFSWNPFVVNAQSLQESLWQVWERLERDIGGGF